MSSFFQFLYVHIYYIVPNVDAVKVTYPRELVNTKLYHWCIHIAMLTDANNCFNLIF